MFSTAVEFAIEMDSEIVATDSTIVC
jgi:hypothetical protein